MTDGKGCTCHAHGVSECGCDGVDWTPQELINARNEIAGLRFEVIKRDKQMKSAQEQVALYQGRDKYLCDRIEAYEAIIEDLKTSNAALKKDARFMAENWEYVANSYEILCEMNETAERILAATEDDK
jgi:hypothetical protein